MTCWPREPVISTAPLTVGGLGTHAVLTSHTGMSSATLFDHLIDVKEGDLILVEVMGETLAYRVDQIKVVLPNEISDLTTVEGHDYLTLFTCTPYAVNSHRLLVRGERVEYTPEIAEAVEQAKPPVFQMETWMWWLLAGAVLGLVVLVFLIARDRRVRRKAGAAASAPAPQPQAAHRAAPDDPSADPEAPPGDPRRVDRE